jgi:surfactin synthase thioesterase subunit
MFFKKKEKEMDKELAKIKELVFDYVRYICYEIEAERLMGQSTGAFTADEFAKMMEDSLNEANAFYCDMKPEEILKERMENKTDVKVIKVEL